MARAPPVDVVRLGVRYTPLRNSCPVRVLNQGHIMYSRHGAAKHSYWMGRLKGIVEVHTHQVEFPLAEPHKIENQKQRRKLSVTGEKQTSYHGVFIVNMCAGVSKAPLLLN
jgi:hypothetical protein